MTIVTETKTVVKKASPMPDDPVTVITLFGVRLHVSFVDPWRKSMNGRDAQAMTICIVRTDAPYKIYSGVAVRSPHDFINQETGQRIAFKRAMEQAYFEHFVKTLELDNTVSLKRFIAVARGELYDAKCKKACEGAQ